MEHFHGKESSYQPDQGQPRIPLRKELIVVLSTKRLEIEGRRIFDMRFQNHALGLNFYVQKNLPFLSIMAKCPQAHEYFGDLLPMQHVD